MSGNRKISVIIPVYNEIDVIDTCYERLTGVMQGLSGYDYDLLFVDDGSKDRTHERLLEFHAQDPHLKVVKFTQGQSP